MASDMFLIIINNFNINVVGCVLNYCTMTLNVFLIIIQIPSIPRSCTCNNCSKKIDDFTKLENENDNSKTFNFLSDMTLTGAANLPDFLVQVLKLK